jgi:hypothetical protein
MVACLAKQEKKRNITIDNSNQQLIPNKVKLNTEVSSDKTINI